VLATPATVRRPYLVDLIDEFARDCTVERLGHPDLVQWIENLVSGSPVPEQALSTALQPFRDVDVDTVVLGCTHYPLIKDLLQRQLPAVKHWVDSGEAIARRAAWLFEQQGLGGESLMTLNSDGDIVDAALFSGDIPKGIGEFLDGLGLATNDIRGNCPSLVAGVIASGSA